MTTNSDDGKYMRLAIEEAIKARDMGEVPVGAVIVGEDGEIISKAHNLCETTSDPTAHAEILAIREAARKLENWRLTGATLYVTLEPCAMCMGAMVLARIKRVVFGVLDSKSGAVMSLYNIGVDRKLNHTVEVKEGVLKDDCAFLLRDFFKSIRLGKS
ncbi:MAG TPA: tRNA adenosine(34) deaminase TadA [Thermodesulfobacteriota bacterium]|nr:tRNA adenosine(34) deaminase TadA [Thermodesulfobacteriota bacterium]